VLRGRAAHGGRATGVRLSAPAAFCAAADGLPQTPVLWGRFPKNGGWCGTALTHTRPHGNIRKSGGAQPIPRRFSRSRLKTGAHRISYVVYCHSVGGVMPHSRVLTTQRCLEGGGGRRVPPRRHAAVHASRGTMSGTARSQTRGDSPRLSKGPGRALMMSISSGTLGWLGATADVSPGPSCGARMAAQIPPLSV